MIDFHCHIDLYPQPERIAAGCEQRGVYVLSVTTTPSAWSGTDALTRGRIRTALGLHPQLAHERKSELPLFDTLLPNARYIGEIGLDGSPEFRRHSEDQLTVFNHILDTCAQQGGRIMSIHSRRAGTPVLDCLQSHPNAGVPVLHWFSGSARELKRAIALGCWFSVGPAMLTSENGRALAASMPRDRVLTESDGPFAQIEGRPVLPWDVGAAIAAFSELWNLPQVEVQQLLNHNLRSLVQNDPARSLYQQD